MRSSGFGRLLSLCVALVLVTAPLACSKTKTKDPSTNKTPAPYNPAGGGHGPGKTPPAKTP